MAETTENQIKCQKPDQFIKIVHESLNTSTLIRPTLATFKTLLELHEGENNFRFEFGCKTLDLSLNYCPAPFNFTVMPLYVICDGHDGVFQGMLSIHFIGIVLRWFSGPSDAKCDSESACTRILLAAKLLQCFTAEKLFENGFGRKTFRLENQCQIFHSKLNYLEARKMSQEQLWESIGNKVEFFFKPLEMKYNPLMFRKRNYEFRDCITKPQISSLSFMHLLLW